MVKFRFPLFCSHKWHGGFWFRIKGWGLHGKDLRYNETFFSEREGRTKHYYLGLWSFKFLSPQGH